MADRTPAEEIRDAVERLDALTDDVVAHQDVWETRFSGAFTEVAAFARAMTPQLAWCLVKWLESFEGIEISEDGAWVDDAQDALAIARAINGTPS